MATTAPGRPVPTLAGHPLLGSLTDLRRDYLGTISRAAREVGPLTRIVAGPPGWRISLYSVASPELTAEVLGRPDRYRKGAPGYRELRQAMGDNLLTSEDDVWRRQRRFVAPLFTPRRIAEDYLPVMVDEADRLVSRWRTAAAAGEVLDAYPEMTGVTVRVIGRILFGADMEAAVPELSRFGSINRALLGRAVQPHPLPRWLPTPANRRLTTELAAVRAVVADLIAERRASPAARRGDDLLDRLLAARDSDHPADRLRDSEVVEQALLFVIAGQETTAVSLACALAALGRATGWQTRVRHELAEVLDGRAPTVNDLTQRLPWTGRVLREAMRLYPAAHGMARSTREEQVLGGYRIPAGSWIEISPWAVHHSAAVWPDPGAFDPARFDVPPGEHPGGHRYAWFPFGAGPRSCIGMQLALLEMQVILAAILQAFTITTPETPLAVHAAITLQPTGPLPLQLSALQPAD